MSNQQYKRDFRISARHRDLFPSTETRYEPGSRRFAGFKGAGFDTRKTVVLTSLIFAAWHISWATLTEEGKLPLMQFPIYMVNAALLGLTWGLLRQLSGSVTGIPGSTLPKNPSPAFLLYGLIAGSISSH